MAQLWNIQTPMLILQADEQTGKQFKIEVLHVITMCNNIWICFLWTDKASCGSALDIRWSEIHSALEAFRENSHFQSVTLYPKEKQKSQCAFYIMDLYMDTMNLNV